jgi:hypothetical protein
MLTSWSRKLKEKMGPVSGDTRPKSSRRTPKRRPWTSMPTLEPLEERTVPTILFKPVDGLETTIDKGGNGMGSPTVYLLFWGDFWGTGAGPYYESQVIDAAQNLLSTQYFSRLTQYRASSPLTFGGYANTFQNDNPSQRFSASNLDDLLNNYIDNGTLPESDTPPTQALYVVVTPPLINSDDPVAQSSNGFTYDNDLETDLDDEVRVWLGGGGTTDFYIDNYTENLSHELAEAVSNPQTILGGLGGFHIESQGFRVNPGSMFPNPPPNSNQICDYEAQDYTHRITGPGFFIPVEVQSYWSEADKAFVIPDGNVQTLTVSNATVGASSFNSATLTIDGNSLSSPNEAITIDTVQDGGASNGGLMITLTDPSTSTAETFRFDPDQISKIEVNGENGNHTITIQSLPAGVNLDVARSTGSDHVVIGDFVANVSSVVGTVTINGNGSTTVEVDDRGNYQAPPASPIYLSYQPLTTSFIIDAGQLTRSAQATVTQVGAPSPVTQTFPTTIQYSNLASLTIDGGPPVGTSPTTYDILGASQSAPVIIKAAGSDAVTLGDLIHNLSGIRSVTVNGNGNTTVEVNDAGNTVIPSPFISYTAISTTFTINDGQLIRTARANGVELVPPNFQGNFTTTLSYTDLASLTVDGGPAVGMASPPTPTPYHILNTSQTGAVIIKATGSDAVTLGDRSDNLSGIRSVTVNGNGNTTVEVNDAGNTVLPTPFISYTAISTTFTINADQLTRSAQALGILPVAPFFQASFTTTLSYTDLASLTVDGGPAVGLTSPPTPTPYHILNTSQAGAVVIKATGSDAVMLGDQSDNLSGINSVTVNGNGRTTLELNDAGNAMTPAQFAAYTPVSTTFAINAGQLTRSAVANVSIQYAQPPAPPVPINNYSITTTVGYSGLASLTVDGGPAVGPNATPYHILNTSQAGAVVINATGSDAVLLGDQNHNLSAISSVTVTGNGSTSLELDDSGNAAIPAGFTSYQPLQTSFTIDAGQLVRRASANTVRNGHNLKGRQFQTTVAYSGLAGLTIDGGPAVAGTVTPYQVLNTPAPFTINAHGSDAVLLGDQNHNLSAISSMTVTGNGSTTLEVNDAGNAAIPAGFVSYAPVSTTFTVDTGQLTRSAVANVSVQVLPPPLPAVPIPNHPFTTTISYSGLAGLTIDGGPAVTDPPTTYQVLSTAGIVSPLTSSAVTINAHGTDAVTVGDANNTMNGIQGTVNVTGNGNTTLNVVDTGTSSEEAYQLFYNQLQRYPYTAGQSLGNPTQTITYSNILHLYVHGGTNADTWFVNSTSTVTITDLYSSGGTPSNENEFVVYNSAFVLDGIQGPLALHGGAGGYDFAEADDYSNTVGHTFTLSTSAQTGTLTRDGIKPITFDGIVELIVYVPVVGRNHFNVQGVLPTMTAFLTASNGDQDVVGSLAPNPGGTMAAVQGGVSFAFETTQVTAPVQLTLDDSADQSTTTHQVTIGVASSPDIYRYVTNLAGNGAWVRWDLPTGSTVKIMGRLGGNETFAMQALQPNLAPVIQAGGPNNTLDYSAYSGDVSVNLHGGTATLLAGISGIQNVTGGNGNNLLLGDANPNILIGGTGLPAGIVSLWTGDGNAIDSVGGNNGTVPTGVTFAPGVTGATGDEAFSFNGSNDLVDLGHDPSLNISGNLTVSAWVDVQSLGHPKYLFADFDTTGHLSQGSLGILSNGHFFWFQGNEGLANGSVEPFGATQLNLNQWYNLAAVRDDNGKTITLYLNGVQDGMVSYTGIPVLALQGDRLLGGAGLGFPQDSFIGLLDEVGLFNRALSAAEIQSIYNSRGSNGRNIIIGGGGADSITAGGGDNILIAGTTSYDQKQAALNAIFAEWTSGDDLATRMNDISGGTPSGLDLNGGSVLVPAATRTHAATVFGDAAVDQLFDGSGLSWFFVHRPDDVINSNAGPSVPGDLVAFIQP